MLVATSLTLLVLMVTYINLKTRLIILDNHKTKAPAGISEHIRKMLKQNQKLNIYCGKFGKPISLQLNRPIFGHL